MIKYLGSKRALLGVVLEAVGRAGGGRARSVLDLFSGTSRVGHALKGTGVRVVANDHNAYAATLARCYVEADREDVLEPAAKLIDEFNRLGGSPGYFTNVFCERSRFLQPFNGERVDAIREAIAAKCLEPELEAVVLTSLLEAADRVDSTTGVQMAFLKSWAPRSHNRLELRVPAVLPRAVAGKGASMQREAWEAAGVEADVVYIDPPYNQHSYLRNYHVWESLVRWDKPEVYGVACKRLDCRDRLSEFNSRRTFESALRRVIDSVRARAMVVSFSDEGCIDRAAMEGLLGGAYGGASVDAVATPHARYVGAKIGIYNPQGVKVGSVGRLTNTEMVYVVTPREPAAGPVDIAAELALQPAV